MQVLPHKNTLKLLFWPAISSEDHGKMGCIQNPQVDHSTLDFTSQNTCKVQFASSLVLPTALECGTVSGVLQVMMNRIQEFL